MCGSVEQQHDWIIPSSQSPAEMMPRILKTWEARGIKPKQHLSEPRPGAVTDREKRGHSDRCKTLPAAMPDDMDLMRASNPGSDLAKVCLRDVLMNVSLLQWRPKTR